MACVSHQQLSRMRSFCCCRPPCPCHLSSLSSAINVKDRRDFRCNSAVNPLFITGLPSNVEQELNTHWSQFRFITLVCPSLTNIWASPPIMSFECSYNFAPPGVIKLFWKIFFNKSWNMYPRCTYSRPRDVTREAGGLLEAKSILLESDYWERQSLVNWTKRMGKSRRLSIFQDTNV